MEEVIENRVRGKDVEEMMKRGEKEDRGVEGMDNEEIKRLGVLVFEENEKKRREVDEMIGGVDEIGKEVKEVKGENGCVLKGLVEGKRNGEKVVVE